MVKKTAWFIFPLFILTFYLTSCTKPDISFGAPYLDNSFTNIVSVDTATAVVSTVYLDSVVTSNSGSAVIGRYNDAYFGQVSSQSYFQMGPPSYIDAYQKTSFDSLEVILKLNKSFYGDSTRMVQLNVNQLQTPITLPENQSALFNVNSFPVDAQPLGSKTLLVRPTADDTIAIRLNDQVGQQLLTLLQNNDDIIKSSDVFVQYFRGLRISPGNTSLMLGFKDTLIMRLHYSEPDVIQQHKWIDFPFYNASLQFNEIKVNRNGTALSGISSTNNVVPSEATNNAGYMQAASGTVVKIGFPYLRNFLQIDRFQKVVRAELIIKPVLGTYSDVFPLPPYLRLSQTDQLNGFGTDITAATTGAASVQYGNLSIDALYGQNTQYTYDVTTYVVAQMALEQNNQNGLLLSPPSPLNVTDFHRLLVGNKLNEGGAIQLKVYYLTLAK